MSDSTEGSQVQVPVISIIEGGVIRPAVAPPGSVFSLGWLMAELFDSRRRVSGSRRRPPFDPVLQLPQVPDLSPDPKLVFLVAELTELVHWYPALGAKTAQVTTETGTLLTAVSELNQAILDEFAADAERLSAYQLGLALSDHCWLPRVAEPGQALSDANRPSALFGLFSRPQLAAVKTLLNGAGAQLPSSAASIVSGSLDNWATWLDVHNTDIAVTGQDAWSAKAGLVLDALRVQGAIWRSVLIADPEVSMSPSMGAWVQAASSIVRASRMVLADILRRFWPIAVILLVILGGLLYLVISNLSGASQVWGSLVTVLAVAGAGGAGLGGGVSRALGGIGYEIWGAAKQDAAVWNVTWLPALAGSPAQRTRLESRGVAAPQIRKNLDPS